MADDIDLTGYPVFRIDQISRIPTETLLNSENDINELMSNLLVESSHDKPPPLISYLKRQLSISRAELATRDALGRVNGLIGSDRMSLNANGKDHIPCLPAIVSGQGENVPAIPLVIAPSIVSVPFKPLPLPSELLWNKSEHKSVDTGKKRFERDKTSLIDVKDKRSVDMLLTSRSNNSKLSDDDNEDLAGINGASDGIHDVISKPRRRRTKSENASASPSKSAMTALYQNFGSQFLVAATEKRIRFYPEKEVKETVEERRENERSER